MEAIKLTVKQIILDLKKISSMWNILSIFIILIIAISIPVIFIPLQYSGGISFLLVNITISGIIYASVDLEKKHSTFYKNSRMTKSNRWVFHSSSCVTMILISLVSTIFLYFGLFIFNKAGLLLFNYRQSGGSNSLGPYPFNLNLQILLIMIYSCIIFTILIFVMSLSIQNIIKDKKTYFILIMSLLILSVIFGGAFNNYYIIGDQDYGLNSVGQLTMIKNPLFPKTIYWITSIMPFYSFGTLINHSIEVFMKYSNGNSYPAGSYFFNNYSSLLGFFSFKHCWQWNLLIITPYIEIIFFS